MDVLCDSWYCTLQAVVLNLSAYPCWFGVNQLSLQGLWELKKPSFKFIIGLAMMNALSFLYVLKYKE